MLSGKNRAQTVEVNSVSLAVNSRPGYIVILRYIYNKCPFEPIIGRYN